MMYLILARAYHIFEFIFQSLINILLPIELDKISLFSIKNKDIITMLN